MKPSNRHDRQWSRLRPGLLALSVVSLQLVFGCKNLFSKGEIKAFRADAKNSWEYLIEKTTNFDGVPASNFAQSGLMPNVSSGTGSILAQSLDSIGVCYWYVKIPKSGPFDGGVSLDFEDGTPNLGIRNNLIARAGVPFTSKALRLTDVLMAMNDAGGDLKKVEQGIVTSAVQMHEMLWNAAAAGGISAASLGAMSPPFRKAYRELAEAAKNGLNGFRGTFPVPTYVSPGAVSLDPALKPREHIVNLNHPLLRNAEAALPASAKDPDSWWHVSQYVIKDKKQIQQIAFDNAGNYLVRTTKENDARNLARYGWQKLDRADVVRLTGLDDKLLEPSTRLVPHIKNFRNLGLGIRQTGRGGANVVKTAAGSVYDAGKNLVKRCTGTPWQTAICSAVVGSVIAGSQMILANTNQANDKLNEEQMNQKVAAFLSNPNLQQNFGAMMQDLTKQTNISTELMEKLRAQLILKSDKSPLPGCNQTFGTEILTTNGVLDQGYGLPGSTPSTSTGFMPSYDSKSVGSPNPFASSSPTLAPALDTLPSTSDSSLAGIPKFNPEDAGSSDMSSTGSSSTGSTLPSVTPVVIPSDSQPSAPSVDSGSSSSIDSGFGTGTALPSESPSSGSSSGEVLQSDPFGPTP